ncbi:MAG: site-2 protease family protein [Nitrospinota bacterium]|nr:site-2 protease family protein [Nitrospinota bacterium]
MDMESQNRPETEQEQPRYPAYPAFSGPRFPINFKTIALFLGLFSATVFTTWWVGGPWYSFGLILILGTHEFGHYWACRVNNVNSSLPNFLPVPPIPYFLNIGTMGAFIMIREPIPNRKALMEIGASGPIAGFMVAVPVLWVGLMNSQMSLGSASEGPNLFFGSSLILWAMTEAVLGVNPMVTDVTISLHPLAYAGWLGMFFTALNLLPLGQLDGGHVVYSLFNRKLSLWAARIFFVALIALGFYWAGWWFWAGLVLILGLRHPPVLDEATPLEPKHRVIGYASLLILILTFVPMPFGVS